MSSPNEVIRTARTRLGLTEEEAARRSGLSTSEFFDLELHEDEAMTVVRLDRLKALCRALHLELSDLLGTGHEDAWKREAPSAPRTERRSDLIRSRRTELGMSVDELGDIVGFDSSAIAQLESDPDYLEGWPIELVLVLSRALGVPPRHLLE